MCMLLSLTTRLIKAYTCMYTLYVSPNVQFQRGLYIDPLYGGRSTVDMNLLCEVISESCLVMFNRLGVSFY
jgi:hypothetical protein